MWIDRDPGLFSAVFGGKQGYDFWKCVFETGKNPHGVSLPKGLT